MSPSLNSEVIPLSEVPYEDAIDANDVQDPVVLVVDDDRLVADTLTLIFRRAGFSAYTAYDARSALSMTGSIRPDILVSDIHMPLMNGVDLAMTLLKKIPECRVLLFSGHATSADLASARAAGYDFPLLTKPVHPAELLKKVAKCLGNGRIAVKSRILEVGMMPQMQSAYLSHRCRRLYYRTLFGFKLK
jgi:DNA-binding response OmpR family regulator